MTEALLAQWKDRVLEAQTEISVVQDEINSVLQQRKALKQSIRRYEDTVAQEKRALLVQLEEVEAKAKDLSARCEATIRQKDEVEAVYVKTLDEYESMHYLVREIKDQEEQLAQREDLEAKLQRNSLAWAEEEHTLRTKLRKLQLARSEELQAQRNEIVTLEAAIAAAEQKQQKARQEHQAGRQQKIHGMKIRMNANNNSSSAVRQGEEEEERVGSAHSHTTSANMNDGRMSQARRSTTRATTAAPSLHNNNNNSISGRNTMPSPVYDNNNNNEEENEEQSNMEKMYNNLKSNRTYPGATRARSAYTLPTSSATAPLTGELSRHEGGNNNSYTTMNNNNHTMASSRMMSMPAIHDPPFESDELAPRSERGCVPNQTAGGMRPLKSCLKNTSSNNTTINNSSGNTTVYPASTNNNNNNSTMNAQNESNTWDTDTHYSSYTRGGNANKPLSAPVSRAGSQSLLAGPNVVQGPYDNKLNTYQAGQTRYNNNNNMPEGSGQRDEVQAFSRAAMMSGGLPTRAYSYNSGKRLSRKRDILGDSTNYQ